MQYIVTHLAVLLFISPFRQASGGGWKRLKPSQWVIFCLVGSVVFVLFSTLMLLIWWLKTSCLG